MGTTRNLLKERTTMKNLISELWEKAATRDDIFSCARYEQFAELIILECTKAVQDSTKEGDHYAQCIEQHFDNGTDGILYFGVKE